MSPPLSICLQRFSNRLRDAVSDRIGFSKSNLALCRMNIYVNRLRIHFQEQKGHWILALHQRSMIALAQPVLNRDIFHRPTVNKNICSAFVDRLIPTFADETGNSYPIGSFRFDFQQLFEQFRIREDP